MPTLDVCFIRASLVFARPKSAILITPVSLISRFSAFKSLIGIGRDPLERGEVGEVGLCVCGARWGCVCVKRDGAVCVWSEMGLGVSCASRVHPMPYASPVHHVAGVEVRQSLRSSAQ